ncbi:MAG: hypothetical protein QOF01_3843, partial [Thermomicrobiales bacterium]|nr:hypothetical protein [Thermomicrobiales bacterium]
REDAPLMVILSAAKDLPPTRDPRLDGERMWTNHG